MWYKLRLICAAILLCVVAVTYFNYKDIWVTETMLKWAKVQGRKLVLKSNSVENNTQGMTLKITAADDSDNSTNLASHDHELHDITVKISKVSDKTVSKEDISKMSNNREEVTSEHEQSDDSEYESEAHFIKKYIKSMSEINSTRSTPSCKVLVPDIVHYIWFHKGQNPSHNIFLFHHLMSLLSVVKVHRPRRIMFWHDSVPTGLWWKLAETYIKLQGRQMTLEMMVTSAPEYVADKKIVYKEHKADVQRLMCLRKYGGIYLDLDVLVIQPLTPLMCHKVTLGRQEETAINNGIILSVPGSQFITYWLSIYPTLFNPNDWTSASVNGATHIANIHPEWVHIEDTSLNRPNFKEKNMIYNGMFNWRVKYCVHLWYRFYGVEHRPETLMELAHAIGDMYRYIWYGLSK